MDTDEKEAPKYWRPEFETTRTCELLSLLAEESEDENSRTPSNCQTLESAAEGTGETNGKTS